MVYWVLYIHGLESTEKYTVEHLIRKKSRDNVYWIHSDHPSDDQVDAEQILKKDDGSK